MDVIRRVVSNTERPNQKPEIPDIIGRLQQLLREPPNRGPAVVNPPVPKMLRSLFDGQRQRQRQPPWLRQQHRDWTDVVCFSCGKLGHTATRCPDFNGAFLFLQPGWRTEKTSGGFTMIPPHTITDRRRAENDGWSGRAGPPLGSVYTFGPGTQEGGQYRLIPDDGHYLMTFLCLSNSSERNLRWSPINVRHCKLDRLRLRTLIIRSVLMMLLERIRALWGIQMIVCLGRMLSHHMGEEGPPPAMFPVAPALLTDEPQFDSWQVAVVRVDETPAGDSSEQESPCNSQNRRRPMDTDNLPNSLAHTVVQRGPITHKV